MPEPELAPARDAIQKQYPAQGPPYNGDPRKRVGALIRDSTFTCNTRQLYDAYKGRSVGVYMMQYDLLESIGQAVHASDLVPTFWNSEMNTTKLFYDFLKLPKWKAEMAAAFFDTSEFPQRYQSYFTSHAITGNPNTYRRSGTVAWQNASDNGNEIVNAMQTALLPFFNGKSKDTINTKKTCDFWKNIAYAMSNMSSADTMQQRLLTVQMEETFWDPLREL
jgi:carboxylesterase type B